MSFWYDPKGDRRLRASDLGRLGVPPGREAECGFLPLSLARPAFSPLFERVVDEGTTITGEAAQVVWTVLERDVAAVKAELTAQLAERRWLAETAGTTVGGLTIQTDRESRGSLTGAAVRADMAIRDVEPYSVRWKTAGGFVDLEAAAVIAAAKAAEAHVRACFVREADLLEMIDGANTIGDLRQIASMIEIGWPGASL